jgi:hypothetical protein
LDVIVAGSIEADGFGNAEVRAERCVERIDVHRVVGGRVEPVGGTLFESAIGCEELHDVGDGLVGVVENGCGALGFIFGDCESADRFAAVADLVPVVVLVMNGFAALDAFEPGVDALCGNCVFERSSIVVGENRLEPGVA